MIMSLLTESQHKPPAPIRRCIYFAVIFSCLLIVNSTNVETAVSLCGLISDESKVSFSFYIKAQLRYYNNVLFTLTLCVI